MKGRIEGAAPSNCKASGDEPRSGACTLSFAPSDPGTTQGISSHGRAGSLHGEYFSSTSSDNNFRGFTMYSSKNLSIWKYEGMVLPQQPNGLLDLRPAVHPLCICASNGNQRTVLSSALLLLAALNSLAATGGEPPQNADSTALLQRGIDLRRSGRDEEALKLFKQADAQHPSPRGRAQIALAEQALGRWVASEKDLSLALASPDDPWIEKNRATLEVALTAVRGHLARIVVLGSPAGAEVSINGERVGRLPLPSPISVVAGRVLAVVEAEGHVPVAREVDARVGELVRETVDLPPTRALTAPPSRVDVGGLNVTTSAPALISVDDIQVGPSPLHTSDVRPGVHVVRALFDGGGESSRKVRVQAGQSASLVLEQPASIRAAIDRKGLHPAIALGAEAVVLGVQKSKQDAGGAVSPAFDLNYGISPAVDLRFGARAVLGQTEHGFLGVLGVPGSARLNLGGTFSLGVGGFVGLRTSPAPDKNRVNFSREIGVLAGPEAFPAILRLGAKHEIELSFEFGWLFTVTTSATTAYDVMHFGLNMTYLLFPPEPAKAPPPTSEPPSTNPSVAPPSASVEEPPFSPPG